MVVVRNYKIITIHLDLNAETTESIGCSCTECAYMKLNTLEKLFNTLKYEWPTIEVDKDIQEKALRPIDRMLEISKALKSPMANK